MGKPHESLTAAGYLRGLSLVAEAEHLGRVDQQLKATVADSALWSFLPAKRTLHFAPALADRIDFAGCSLAVSYADTAVLERVSYRNPFREIKLPSGRKIVAERSPVAEFLLEGREVEAFVRHYLNPGATPGEREHAGLKSLHTYESLAEGLQEYF